MSSKTWYERDASRDARDIASREDLDAFKSGRREKRRNKKAKGLKVNGRPDLIQPRLPRKAAGL